MKGRICRGLSMGLLVCGVMGAGCRSRMPGSEWPGGPGSEELDPTQIGVDTGEFALADRVGGGVPVTDVQFDNVLFGYDSFQVDPGETRKIEQVAAYLRDNANVRLVLEGHCDERGSREYNLSLGEYRALAVRAHLIGTCKIDGARIQTRSFGEEQPLDPGHNEAAWRVNRRVAFALFR